MFFYCSRDVLSNFKLRFLGVFCKWTVERESLKDWLVSFPRITGTILLVEIPKEKKHTVALTLFTFSFPIFLCNNFRNQLASSTSLLKVLGV